MFEFNIKTIFWKFFAMNRMQPQGVCLKGYFVFYTLFLLVMATSGCGNKFFDPAQVGRFNQTPVQSVILDTLGVAEEPSIAWQQGEEPRPADTIATKSDYTFLTGDIIDISVYELLSQGQLYEQYFTVSETGKISIPVVNEVDAAGLTETQLEGKIKKILAPNILINPIVNVKLVQSPKRTYSILGDGVRAPNRYSIPRYNFRLQDALALAGGASQVNVSYIYVTRQVMENKQDSKTSKNDIRDYRTIRSPYNLGEPVSSNSTQRNTNSYNFPAGKIVVTSSEMVTDREANRYANRLSRNYSQYGNNLPRGFGSRNTYQLSDMQTGAGDIQNRVSVDEALKRVSGQHVDMNETKPGTEVPDQTGAQKPLEQTGGTAEENHTEWIFQNGNWVPVVVESPGTKPASGEKPQPTPSEETEWEMRNGQWVPVQKGEPEANIPQTTIQQETTKIEQQFPWIEQTSETRLIKIPIDKLIAGDPRYNIVIKPGDTIVVPLDVAGKIYVMGNVNRPGTMDLTGGQMTLKQIIAAAGNFGPLAWPKKCEITRRLGNNKEVTALVDLDKIFNGEQPDIYVKPQDIINVGTDLTSRWRAILRNAFRATYGFGFVYDRNFADRDFYTSRPFDIF